MPAPRKADALHELQDTRPHDRAVDFSHVPPGRPKFPKDLDKSLRPVFKRVCKQLQERRTLTAGDMDLIRLYCFVFDRHARNVALLREEGEICTYVRLDSNGQPHDVVKENIRNKVVTQCERQMAALFNQLGLTPTSKDRAKPTGKPKTAEVDPDELFLQSKPAAKPILMIRPDAETCPADEETPIEEVDRD